MVAACGAVAGSILLFWLSPDSAWGSLAGLGALAVLLGVGYTMPPLKLSHRGLGELTVALVHSFLTVHGGALVMGHALGDPKIMQVGLPLFFAIFPSIGSRGSLTLGRTGRPESVVWRCGSEEALLLS